MFEKYQSKKRQLRGTEIDEVTENTLEIDETRVVGSAISGNRLKIFRWLAFLSFLFLASKVFYLQILRGDYYGELSRENRIRGIVIKAPRGLILDRNGKKLVNNIPSFDMIAVPADLPREKEEKDREIKELGEILGMNDQNIAVIIGSQDSNSLNPVLVKENISEEQAFIVSERKSKLKGFDLFRTAVRKYEDGKYFSSIIGYNGKIDKEELSRNPDYLMTDSVGKSGLEYQYEKILRGLNGKQEVEVDSAGNIKKDFGAILPVEGSDLSLGLDSDLQKKLQDTLQSKLDETKTKTAAAVAIDPRNGEILAMVSLPTFDNNLFAKGISGDEYQKLISDPEKPMFNRAITGEYPPGSTFKAVVAAAALQEKIVAPDTSVDCNGAIHIGSFNFPDWKTHGITDIRKAIAESCDVFFYAVGGGWNNIGPLGIDRIKKYANLFGLGKPLGVDVPGEASGLIPDKTWKQDRFNERWYIGDDYHCSIGQGFDTATPLQMANVAATVANGGKVFQPHFVSSIKNPDGSEEKIEPKILNQNFVTDSNMQVVREGMRQTITSGSARQLGDLNVAVAGKTGTAQYGEEGKTHGWFISFAPYDNPTIALAVLMEGGGEGSSTAVPVTKEVYKWYFGNRN
jgi:penicillin-binding protein 2